MAVIKYSGLVDQLRGKLNGTVFSRFHAGFNTYRKGQPSRWGSDTQQQRRQGLSLVASAWKNLTPAQRSDWKYVADNTPVSNRLGDLVTLPAFHYFVKYAFLYKLMGFGNLTGVSTDLTKPYQYSLLTRRLSATLTDAGYVITELYAQIRIEESTSLSTYDMFYVSEPLPADYIAYQGTQYYVGRTITSAGRAVNSTLGRTLTDVVMPSGWSTYQGAYHYVYLYPTTYQTGQRRSPNMWLIQIDYTPPAPPVWPLTWSFSGNDARFTELQPVGGDWKPAGSGVWVASPGQDLPGVAADYEFELAMSPNLFGSDIARPEEFDVPRPTLSGTLAAKSGSAPYYITPDSIANLQSFMNANFTYTSGDGYLYQPTAIRIKNPTTGAWSNWGYSNIWLPIF